MMAAEPKVYEPGVAFAVFYLLVLFVFLLFLLSYVVDVLGVGGQVLEFARVKT
jgi:hypothetical protein